MSNVGATSPLPRDPRVLYRASIERMREADLLHRADAFSMAIYTAGLAVEAMLQAHALRRSPMLDARHDLRLWLSKCPEDLVRAVRLTARSEWSYLSAMWENSLRYLSEDGLLGYLRSRGATRGIKTGSEGPRTYARVHSLRLVDAARIVHDKGVVLWRKN